jgi:hypothetical protein
MKGYMHVIFGMEPDLSRSLAAAVVQASCGGDGALGRWCAEERPACRRPRCRK